MAISEFRPTDVAALDEICSVLEFLQLQDLL